MARTPKTSTGPTESNNNVKRPFPEELLSRPWEERFAYYEQQRFRHAHLEEARDELIDAILYPCGKATINIFGPTGAGKTTLLCLIADHFAQMMPEITQTTGHTHHLILRAPAAHTQRFGWKDFYKLWIHTLYQQHPEADVDFEEGGIRRDKSGRLIIEDRVSVYALRRAATTLTCRLKPLFIGIDEAPHIKKIASGDRIADQMDVIKCWTEDSETVFALVGTYELLQMTNLNGQQGRRSRDIHLKRYKSEGADWEAFKKLLRTCQQHMPLPETPDLMSHSEYLYTESLGCIGVLKPWLDDTLRDQLQHGKATITRRILEKHAPAPGKTLRIAKEIWEGEQELLRVEQECEDKVKKYLGIVAF